MPPLGCGGDHLQHLVDVIVVKVHAVSGFFSEGVFSRCCRALPDTVPGESGPLVSVLHDKPTPSSSSSLRTGHKHLEGDTEEIVLYSINIRCVMANLAELCHHLEEHKPHIVFLQESRLDKSTEEIRVPGYREISRRERHGG